VRIATGLELGNAAMESGWGGSGFFMILLRRLLEPRKFNLLRWRNENREEEGRKGFWGKRGLIFPRSS
jgi:hypothetical protein